jgi:hypothetical protein
VQDSQSIGRCAPGCQHVITFKVVRTMFFHDAPHH